MGSRQNKANSLKILMMLCTRIIEDIIIAKRETNKMPKNCNFNHGMEAFPR